MLIFTIFFVIFKSFILSKFSICHAAHKFTNINVYNTTTNNINNNTFYAQKNTHTINYNYNNKYNNCYLKKLNNLHDNDKIYMNQYNYSSVLTSYKYVNNTSHIQLHNDSINILYIFHNYLNKFIYKKMVFFLQIGIQDFLSKKYFSLGTGKKYTYYNHIMGWNVIFHFPELSQKRQPYSVNIGGLYYYNNFTLIANSYYNINNYIYSYKNFLKSKDNTQQYPKIGYQICIENTLPYLSKYKGQIKWEKINYNKINIESCDKNFNNINVLCLTIGYQPVSLCEISINNYFMHKKYFDTIASITLNYQFNMPLLYQITRKHYYQDNYNNFRLDLENRLHSIVKSFIPATIYSVKNNHNKSVNPCNTIQKIQGYPGEIKLIKIDNTMSSNLQWNRKIFQNQGGKIIYIKKNMYAIQLPKYSSIKKTHISLMYNIKNNINTAATTYQTQQIPILLQSYISKFTKFQLPNNNVTQTNNNQLLSDANKNTNHLIQQIHYNNNSDHYSIINHPTLLHDTTSQNCKTHDNHNIKITTHNNDNEYKNDASYSPPIPPPLMLVTYTTACNQISVNQSEQVMQSIAEQNHSSIGIAIKNAESASSLILQENYLNKNINSNHNKLDLNTNNLLHRLSMHKKHKFSSIEQDKYVENLEKSLIERKKNRYLSDMEKIFNKLKTELSHSSIDESIKTNNSSNNFSTSSTQ